MFQELEGLRRFLYNVETYTINYHLKKILDYEIKRILIERIKC